MGNRAVIALDNDAPHAMGIYLHWNGGRDSVESFLLATQKLMAGRLGDKEYGRARLIQVITTFISGNLSVGLGHLDTMDTDNGDNGMYIVDTGTMEIVDRKFHDREEQAGYDVEEFAEHILNKIEAGNKWAEEEDAA